MHECVGNIDRIQFGGLLSDRQITKFSCYMVTFQVYLVDDVLWDWTSVGHKVYHLRVIHVPVMS